MSINPTAAPKHIPLTLANATTDFASTISVGAKPLKAGDAFVTGQATIPSNVGFGNAFLENVEAPEFGAVADFDFGTQYQGGIGHNIADYTGGVTRAILCAPEAGMNGLNTAFAAPTVFCTHVMSDPKASTGAKILAGAGFVAAIPLAFLALLFKGLSFVFNHTTSALGRGTDRLIHRGDHSELGEFKKLVDQGIEKNGRAEVRKDQTEYVRNRVAQ